MTAAIGLKRLAIAAAALVAAAFATLIGLSFLIPAATVRDAVKKEIRAVTGLDPQLRGDVSVSLFPHATATFHNVTLGDEPGGEPAMAAEEMTARLRYFPLLAGRIEIADVTLVRPTINVTFAASGQSNWSRLTDSLAHSLGPSAERTASFSEIAIHDGTIVVHDVKKGFTERLNAMEFQVAWPSISRSFGANGRFVWHDEPVDASLTLADFAAALNGQHSGVKLRLSSAPLNLAFDGAGSNRPTLRLEGTLNVESPSLRDAMHWAGDSRLGFGGFGRFALRARSSVAAGAISLTNVDVELDGNRAEGVLTLSADDPRGVQGTLAADSLDLTPYISGVRLLATTARTWDRLPLALDGLSDFDLDLRLSAATIRIAGVQLGRTAMVANMRGGKLNVTIGESQAFGGVAKGSLGVASTDGGVAVSSHVQFVDVDLASCLGQVFGLHKLEGRGTLSLNVDGSGNSVLAVTRTLNGTITLIAQQGGLVGIDVEQLLRRLEKRPLSGVGDFHSGRTPFDRLVLSLKIDKGAVSVDDLHIEGPAIRLAVAGEASVPTREVDLKGTATLVSSATGNEFELPFVIYGPWDDPNLMPDPQSLIRHSGAAAPLLRQIKSHSAGDAVRSVIDQLFAGPPSAPTASAPTPQPATSPAGPAGAK